MSSDKIYYCPIPISRLIPEVTLPVDVFLLVDGKHIKFKEKGDMVPSDKYDFFMRQNLSSCYVVDCDFQVFVDWLNKQKEKQFADVKSEVGVENEGIIEEAIKVRDKVYDTFAGEKLNVQKVEKLQEQAAEFVEQVKQNPIIASLLAKLDKHNDSIVEHCYNVANFAVFFALISGTKHQYVLENVYLSGIFHDYSLVKNKMNKELKFKNQDALYLSHPTQTAEILEKIKVIPQPVIDIILQHHEQYDGGGFPHSLKGDAIYELAQVVHMASYFDDKFFENKDNRDKDTRFKVAVKALQINSGKLFNPKLVSRVVEALVISKEAKFKVAA